MTKETKRKRTEPIKVKDFIALCNKAQDREEVMEALKISHTTFGKYYKIYRNKGEIPELDKRVRFTQTKLDELRLYFKK
jgi:hypothetical protein